jgi:hypothetical protein
MTEKEFIYWLKGFLDAYVSSNDNLLTLKQIHTIKETLNKVRSENNKSYSYIKDENTSTTLLLD